MNRMDSFNTITSAAYILLMFLSTMFYPLDGLPMWFQTLAMLNPMTWQVDILRFSLLGTGDPTTLALEAIGVRRVLRDLARLRRPRSQPRGVKSRRHVPRLPIRVALTAMPRRATV